MPSFAVEVYTPGLDRSDLDALGDRMRSASEVLFKGLGVRYVESLFFPADELCLHLFEGPSAEAVGETSELAGIVIERVVEAVFTRGDDPRRAGDGTAWGGQDSNPRHEG